VYSNRILPRILYSMDTVDDSIVEDASYVLEKISVSKSLFSLAMATEEDFQTNYLSSVSFFLDYYV